MSQVLRVGMAAIVMVAAAGCERREAPRGEAALPARSGQAAADHASPGEAPPPCCPPGAEPSIAAAKAAPAACPTTKPVDCADCPHCQAAASAASGAPRQDMPACCPATQPAPDQPLAAAPACCPATQPAHAPAVAPSPGAPAAAAISAPSATQPAKRDGPIVSDWIEPSQRQEMNLDFPMTNQDGQPVKLSDLRGKPLAMSFIFTRCPNPKMCPLIATTFAKLQRDLDKAGLAREVNLVLVSYDPSYDTPPRLKAFAQNLAFRTGAGQSGHALRPDPDHFAEFLMEFQITARFQADGTVDHVIELMLLDAKGRFVRDYKAGIWDNAAALADLKLLAAERGAAGK